jgi:hypothetical protein
MKKFPYEFHTDNIDKLRAVITFLFSKGLTSYGESVEEATKKYFKEYPYLAIYETRIAGNYSAKPEYAKISFEEIFDMFYQPQQITIELNDEYEAVVSKDGIQVGCQKISFDKLDEINAARKELGV